MVSADLAGFADAQRRLRDQFGESVVFLQPPTFSFPAGTQIDPDSGQPFDPAVTPTASAQASAAVNCSVAFAAQDDAEREGPAGFVDRTRVMLIADIADRDACEGAVTAVLRGENFQITSMKPDGIGGLQRWLTYARRSA